MAAAAASASLKDYLKRYESNNTEEEDKKMKKRRKKKKGSSTGVLIVDEDPVWQKPVVVDEEEENESPDEKPQVDEDIEVKRMKRLEELRAKRPYHAISEDGSGWVSVSQDLPLNSTDGVDFSPPRHNSRRCDSQSPDSDLSPPRQRHYDSPSPDPHNINDQILDISPPRRRQPKNTVDPEYLYGRERHDSPVKAKSVHTDLSPPRKTKEQGKTGLITGKDIKEEILRKKHEELSRFKMMDPSASGVGAETIYRDRKKGVRISKDEYDKSQKKEEKPKEEKKLEWGKGLAQKRESEAKLLELEVEKDKPFARSRDDPDLDRMLKDAMRWGDPMAHLVKRKQSAPVLPDLGDDEKMKESGFIVPQEIPSHSWIKRGLEAAPNRYGIKPGRHWDGVDRSNGYEKELFKRMNEKQATEREAYLWSVSDM